MLDVVDVGIGEKAMIRRIALILLLLLAAPFAAQAQWVEHRPPGAGYRIEFPRTPTTSSQDVPTDVGTVKLYHATVEIGQTMAFVALHNVFPAGSVKDPKAALDRGRDGALRAPSRKLVEERRMTVSGAPATRLVVEETKQGLILIALIVVSGDNMYQAIFVSPKGGENSPDGQRFLSSLALVGMVR